jgi:hypothetical protein
MERKYQAGSLKQQHLVRELDVSLAGNCEDESLLNVCFPYWAENLLVI